MLATKLVSCGSYTDQIEVPVHPLYLVANIGAAFYHHFVSQHGSGRGTGDVLTNIRY